MNPAGNDSHVSIVPSIIVASDRIFSLPMFRMKNDRTVSESMTRRVNGPRVYTKLLIFTAVQLLSAGSLYAGWIAVGQQYQTPSLQTVYFDRDSISREGNWVKLWQMTDIKWKEGALTPKFLSVKTHKQFDCVNGRFRVLAVVEFSRQMGTGKAAPGYIENGNWQTVEKQSANHGLLETACGKP